MGESETARIDRDSLAAVTGTIIRVLLATIAIVVLLAVLDSHNDLRLTAAVYIPPMVGLAVAEFLRWLGQGRAAAWVVSVTFWCLVTAIVLFFGGLSAHNGTAWIVSIMIAGATLGSRHAIGFAAASALAACGVMGLEALGGLPEPVGTVNDTNGMIAVNASLVLAAVLFYLALRERKRAFEAATDARHLAERREDQAHVLRVLGAKIVDAPNATRAAGLACAAITSNLDVLGAAVAVEMGNFQWRVIGASGVRRRIGEAVFLDSTPQRPEAEPAGKELIAQLGGERGLVWALGGSTPALLVVVDDRPNALEDGERDFLCTTATLVRASLDRETENRRALESQRLEVVGQLTAGVAHDLNNLLTVVSATPVVLADEPLSNPGRVALRDLQDASDRAALLTRSLLTTVAPSDDEPSTVDLNGTIRKLATLARRVLPGEVELVLDFPDRDIWVSADRVEIEQLLLNLIINARDAMAEKGRIEVRLSGNGDTASLEVQDDGFGMGKTCQRRAFQPFFTTKAKGTGLGLATVHDIVLRLGGSIEITSERGVGTTFRIELPLLKATVVDDATPIMVRSAPTGLRVLIVEGNDLVRRQVTRALESVRWEIVALPDAAQALALIGAGASFDVVITDRDMPGLSGTHLVNDLVESGMPVVVTSGEEGVQDTECGAMGAIWLPKPFTTAMLMDAAIVACAS